MAASSTPHVNFAIRYYPWRPLELASVISLDVTEALSKGNDAGRKSNINLIDCEHLAGLHMIAELHLQTAGLQVRLRSESSVTEIPGPRLFPLFTSKVLISSLPPFPVDHQLGGGH